MTKYKLMKLTPKGQKVAIVEVIPGKDLVKVKEVTTKTKARKILKFYNKRK
jgi:hypothetical protein